ncbi:MAG: hypothetical protein RIT41_724 [Bacteroidota bacterium]
MKICFIGTGYVGLVSGVCFSDLGNSVICIDKDREKLTDDKKSTFAVLVRSRSQIDLIQTAFSGLNIPTGIPLHYALNADLTPTVKGGKYLDPAAAADAIKFTVDQAALSIPVLGNEDALLVERGQTQLLTFEEQQAQLSCSLDNPDSCEACGS